MRMQWLAHTLLSSCLVLSAACGDSAAAPKIPLDWNYPPIESGDGDSTTGDGGFIPGDGGNAPGDGDGDGDGEDASHGDADASADDGDDDASTDDASIGDGDAGTGDGDLDASTDAGTDDDPDAGLGDAGSDAGTDDDDLDASTDAGTDADAGTDDGDGAIIRGPAPTRASASKNGTYAVKSYTSGYRDGPNFASGTIWYPSDATAPFAIVAIVPGWVSSEGDITDWGPFLASHGIVNITIGTNSPLTDLPPARKDALLDALRSLREENTRALSPLFGKLDTSRQAVIGWSMGGGGALLAASENPSLKAAISLCGWGGYDYSKNIVPTFLFASVFDVLAGGQTPGFYSGNSNSIPATTPKGIYEVATGDHWTANNPAHESGQIGLYGLSWLKVFLEGDERYRQFFKDKPQNASDYRTANVL